MLRGLAESRRGQRRAGEALRALTDTNPAPVPAGRSRYVIGNLAPASQALPDRLASRQPSWLLAAQHEVVPFGGRESTLAALASWRDDDWNGPLVKLVHGPGGVGKTRLARQFGGQTTNVPGWRVGVAGHVSASRRPRRTAKSDKGDVRPGPDQTWRDFEQGVADRGFVLVVDYADRWPVNDLVNLIAECQHRGRGRILFLARAAGPWWDALRLALGDLGVDSDALLLGSDSRDRVAAFTEARDSFATFLGVADAELIEPPANLSSEPFGLVLTQHMAALAAVDARRRTATSPQDLVGLTTYLLGREREYWQKLGTADDGRLTTSRHLLSRAVYVATLAGPLEHTAGCSVLSQIGIATGQAAIEQVLADHAVCYPAAEPRTVLEPMYPDRLGEDFVALSSPGHDIAFPTDAWVTPTMLRALLSGSGARPATWTGPVLTTMIEVAARWPHFATGYVSPVLTSQPECVLTTDAAALVRLAEIGEISLDIFCLIEETTPTEESSLDVGLAAIARRILDNLNTIESDRQIELLPKLAKRFLNSRQHNAALSCMTELVRLLRPRAESDAARRPELAQALANLGATSYSCAQAAAAHVAARESLGLWEDLAKGDPGKYDSQIAHALDILGAAYAETGQPLVAVPHARRSVAIYRRLFENDSDSATKNLALALSHLSNGLSALDMSEEALAAIEEAVSSLEPEAGQSASELHQGELANLLMSLDVALRRLGRIDEALIVATRTVGIYRSLAESHGAKYEFELAISLSNLGSRYRVLGSLGNAKTVGDEAVAILEQMAPSYQKIRRLDLAKALNNLSATCSDLGYPEKALAIVERAIRIYRELGNEGSAGHFSDFAIALAGASRILAILGRHDESITAYFEVVDIHHRLAVDGPAIHKHAEAKALHWLSVLLNRNQHLEQAIAVGTAAIATYRQLDDSSPDSMDGLAGSLGNVSVWQWQLGRHDEAIALANQEVLLRRRRAGRASFAWLGDTASVQRRLGMWLSQRGDAAASVPLTDRAIAVYRLLERVEPGNRRWELANAISDQCIQLYLIGEYAKSYELSSECATLLREIPEDQLSEHAMLTIRMLVGQGNALAGLEKYGDSLNAAERAIAMATALPAVGARSELLAMSLTAAGMALTGLGDLDEALERDRRSMALRRTLADADPACMNDWLVVGWDNLGSTLSRLHRWDEAASCAAESVAAVRQMDRLDVETYESTLGRSLRNQAVWLSMANRWPEAMAPSAEAVEVYDFLASNKPNYYLSVFCQVLRIFVSVRINCGAEIELAFTASNTAIRILSWLTDTVSIEYQRDLAAMLAMRAELRRVHLRG